MTNKRVDADNLPVITPAQERAVAKAFERYDSDAITIRVPQREHLGSKFKQNVSCAHGWFAFPHSEENNRYAQQLLQEQDTTSAAYCGKCGALALFETAPNYMGTEQTQLWAYDATARFFGKPPKQERSAKPQTRR